MNRLVRRVIGVMLFAVLIYGAIVLYRGVDHIAHRFQTYAWSTFAIACGLAFSNYLLRFLKWQYYLGILEIRGIPVGESLLTFLSGFVLTVTPGKVGEVFKSLILHETRGVPVVRTAPIVVAERVTDLIGVITLIAIGSASFPGGLIWMSLGVGLVVSILVFISWRPLSSAVLRALPRLPGALGRFGGRVAPKLAEALDGLRDLTTPRRLVWPTLLSIAAWSLEGIALWVILRGFGEAPPIKLTAFFYATATLAGAIIPVPGGLGVTEKLLEEQMARLGGVSPVAATGAMLLVRFATLWFAVAVGFVALALLRAKYPGLATGDGAVKDPAKAAADTLSPQSDARKDASSAG
jgi:uncharacterized protein (TIRG00374 family)